MLKHILSFLKEKFFTERPVVTHVSTVNTGEMIQVREERIYADGRTEVFVVRTIPLQNPY